MTQNNSQRVRLRATTTFVREWNEEVFEGDTVEETLATAQAIYDEEPLDTAFERYVERSLSQNEQTVVELAEAGPLVLSSEVFDELAARETGEPNEAMVRLFRGTRGHVLHTDPKSVRIRELEAERDELAKMVARINDHISALGMDRENWGHASRLQDILDGTD